MNRSESVTKIAEALVKAQRSMGNATKDSKNPFFKSSYATLNAVREAVIPALNENDITLMQPTVELDGKFYVETLLLHISGEFVSGLTEVVVAKDKDPQAVGSGISYARRYGLSALLCIGAEDDDAEAAMDRKKSAKSNPENSSGWVTVPAETPLAITAEAAPNPTTAADAGGFKRPATKANGKAGSWS